MILSARGFVILAELATALCRDAGLGRAWLRARTASLALCAALMACSVLYFWPQQARLYGPVAGKDDSSTLVTRDFLRQSPVIRRADEPPAIMLLHQRDLVDQLGPLNCPRLDCPTIFAYSPTDEIEQRLRAAFPGRAWYRLHHDAGVLTVESAGLVGPPPAH